MDLPGRRDLFAVGRRAIVDAEAPRINPKVVDVDGSDLNLVVNSGALMGEELSRSFGRCMAGLFVGTAKGAPLDRVIMDRTGGLLPRKDASPATADVRIARPTSANGAGIVPATSRVTTPGGVTFTLDVDVAFGASDLFQDTTVTCTQTGPAGNVPATASGITRFLDQPYDSTMTVSQLENAAGGAEREDDVRYAARYFGFFVSIRRGVLPSIRLAALEVPGVAVAAAAEILNGNGFPAGAVQLYVADQDGNWSSSMLQAVRDNLLTYRAGGIPVFVGGGQVAYEAVSWKVAYESGVDTVTARNQLRAVTVAVAQFLDPDATLYRSSLIAGGRAVPGVVLGEASLLEPVGDVVPALKYGVAGAMIRIRPEDVTIA